MACDEMKAREIDVFNKPGIRSFAVLLQMIIIYREIRIHEILRV
jgi:hypothetical protein